MTQFNPTIPRCQPPLVGPPVYRFLETVIPSRRDPATGLIQVQIEGVWVDASESAHLVKSRAEWVEVLGDRPGIPCYLEFLKALGVEVKHRPEYDWEDLEAKERRSREDPTWYKRPGP